MRCQPYRLARLLMPPTDFWTFTPATVISIFALVVSLASAVFTGWKFFSDRKEARNKSSSDEKIARQSVKCWVDTTTGQLTLANNRPIAITGIQVTWAEADGFPRTFVLRELSAGRNYTFTLDEVPAEASVMIDYSVDTGEVWRVQPGRVGDADLPDTSPTRTQTRRSRSAKAFRCCAEK